MAQVVKPAPRASNADTALGWLIACLNYCNCLLVWGA